MSLQVDALGSGATLQDGGRPGYRRFGVPVGGAFDRESLALCNALVGNGPTTAGLELTVMGGRFRADDRHEAAYVGADLEIKLSGEVVSAGRLMHMKAGDVLNFGPMSGGARGYLCIAGGFASEALLGSVSGIAVRRGDLLCPGPSAGHLPAKGSVDPPRSLNPRAIRVLPGPQMDRFSGVDFAAGRYEVSSAANRAGIRLLGTPIPVPGEAPSEPACVGAVQITGDGLPVIIGPDGPTVGGYPKIACVVEADLNRLAQVLPGDELDFQWVSAEGARSLREAEERLLAAQCAELVRSRGA